MSNYLVYVHVFPNGKKYVGITSQTTTARWSRGNGYKKCPKVYKAIQKYGWDNIEHIVITDGLTKEAAEMVEMALIETFDSIKNGYNIDHGGNCAGTHSEETKRKISEGNKGKKKPCTDGRREALRGLFSGEQNPFFGKHHSEETRAAQSNRMRGNQFNKGNHHTEGFKRWKSEQMKEKYQNGGNPRSKRVVMTSPEGAETVFFSLRNAAETANVSPSLMFKLIRTGDIRNGYQWRYADESRT